MFNVNKQTMYVISDIGSTAVSKKTVEYFSPFEQIQVKPAAVTGYSHPTYKTRGEATKSGQLKSPVFLEKKNVKVDVIVAEVRAPVKKSFWQKLFS